MSFLFILYVSSCLISYCNCIKVLRPEQIINQYLELENPSSSFPPREDEGNQPPFKYPFAYSLKNFYNGCWTRQVTVRELPISKKMAGFQTRLIPSGVRELHWHVFNEWGFVVYGQARITAVDPQGRSFIEDVKAGDIWLFEGGYPHSVQATGPDGCLILPVFDDGNIDSLGGTFLLSDWLKHVPKDVLAKNFQVKPDTFTHLPTEPYHFLKAKSPLDLQIEKTYASQVTGQVPRSFAFLLDKMKPNISRTGGEVKIVDKRNFPVTNIAAAIVKLKPGALRELHWHPNADEWQYYVTGRARMGVFAGEERSRTMDFQSGDVGYIEKSVPHYVENTGTEDLVFMEVFPDPYFEDISLAEWLAHTPYVLVNEHIKTGYEFIQSINKTKAVIVP